MAFPEFFWQTLFGLYVLVTILQLVVWLGFFWQLGIWKKPITNHQSPILPAVAYSPPSRLGPIKAKEGNQSTSIILCARNEAENLRRNLPEVLAQRFDGTWELLVVDDASEDDTPAVLQFFLEKNPERLRVLRIPEKIFLGKKHALAQGIAAAKYDLLLLTDADCRPGSLNWLAQMAAALTAKPETEIVLGYGPVVASSDDSKSSDECHASGQTTLSRQTAYCSQFSRYETAFTAAQYFSFALAGMPYMGVGRNLAFKRKTFDRVGGFAKHAHIASGDDDLLVNAAANSTNTAICLDPESFMYSEAPPNFRAWLKQKWRHLSASPVYRWRHKIALAVLAASHVGHYGLLAVLLLAGFAPKIVVAIFLLRLFSVLFVFGKILRVLREPGLFWRIPFYDAMLAGYYAAVVPWFLIGKRGVAEWYREK